MLSYILRLGLGRTPKQHTFREIFIYLMAKENKFRFTLSYRLLGHDSVGGTGNCFRCWADNTSVFGGGLLGLYFVSPNLATVLSFWKLLQENLQYCAGLLIETSPQSVRKLQDVKQISTY